jgi:hypothetical protein
VNCIEIIQIGVEFPTSLRIRWSFEKIMYLTTGVRLIEIDLNIPCVSDLFILGNAIQTYAY